MSMSRAHLPRVVLLAVLPVAPLSAQERESPFFAWLDKTGKTVIALFDRPLHPTLGSVAPGGGIGTGLAFETPEIRRWNVSLEGLYTVRRYWEGEALLQYAEGRARGAAYGRLRDMPKLDFFGPGSDSDEGDRTNFAFREGVVGALAALRVTPWLTLGARAEALWPDIGPGRSEDVPGIERRFDEASAPGLTQQPRFGRYEGSVDLIVPAARPGAVHQGGNYRLTYSLFSDQELDQFSFQRFEAEGQHRFAPFGNLQRLTVRGWFSTTSTSSAHQVPFYLQRTLGGIGDLRSVSDMAIGSDGTQATLRGFAYYRFRDRHLMLMQAEYRIPLWGPVDATLFAETGKVTSRRADLDFDNLKRSYGGSLSFMRGSTTAARLDLGLGGEGTRLFILIGRDFMP